MSEDKSDLKESLETLEKALEASQHSITTPVFQVEDLSEMAHKYLTAGARYDLSQKATQQIVTEEDGSVFKAIYFATRVRSGNQEKAVQALARVLNDMSQRGLIHSTLAPISSIELARSPLQSQTNVVFCFVLVPDTHAAYCSVRYKKFYTPEGGVGQSLEDLSPILQDGEFLAEVRIVRNFMSQADPKEALHDEISRYIAILPKGTVVRQIVRCAVIDMTVPYEIKFYNPLLKKVKRVDIEYARDAEMVNEKLEQFNVFLGISYFDAYNHKLYHN